MKRLRCECGYEADFNEDDPKALDQRCMKCFKRPFWKVVEASGLKTEPVHPRVPMRSVPAMQSPAHSMNADLEEALVSFVRRGDGSLADLRVEIGKVIGDNRWRDDRRSLLREALRICTRKDFQEVLSAEISPTDEDWQQRLRFLLHDAPKSPGDVPPAGRERLRNYVRENRLEPLLEQIRFVLGYWDGLEALKAEAHHAAGWRDEAKLRLDFAISIWDEQKAGEKQKAGQRSFWKRLFFRGSAPLDSRPAKSTSRTTEWEKFFEFAEIHESLRSSFKSFVGSWPSGVDPALFGGGAGKKLVARLHAFVTGPYPVESLKDSSPRYREIDGKIARVSNEFLDLMICTVVPRSRISGKEPPAVVWSLIEEYSRLPLARLLFTLSHLHLISWAREGKTAILITKDGDAEMYSHLDTDQILRIQVFKGVENTIFGVYHDLPEGGYLSEQAIDKKIRSLLLPL
jgi:hypothetical protein